jgi:hypothetical protein
VLGAHVLGQRGLMLDIGANVGFYGLMGIRMGCETLFFDLQKGCQERINNAIVLNGYTSVGRVIPHGIHSGPISFKTPAGGCRGNFPASAHETHTFDVGEVVSTLDTLDKLGVSIRQCPW